jgi:hypothetical protein
MPSMNQQTALARAQVAREPQLLPENAFRLHFERSRMPFS